MRKNKYYPAFLLGVLMMIPFLDLCAQERDSIIADYLNKIDNSDSAQFYAEKLYQYTIDKPILLEDHLISCTQLLDLSSEKFDSPTNKNYIQTVFNLTTADNRISHSERMNGFRILGDYYHKLSKIDQAIKFYHQGILIADIPSIQINEAYLSVLYTNLSNLYLDLNELTKARLMIEKTIELDISTEGSISEYLGIDYIILARTYRPIDPEKSLLFFLKAKNQFNTLIQKGEQINQPEELKDLYILTADNYLALGNTEQALLEIDTALTFVKNINNKIVPFHGKALRTKATILQHKGDYRDALKQYQLANRFLENKRAAITYQPKTLLQMARCYLAINQPFKAQEQLTTALNIIDQSGPPHQSRLDKVTFPKDLFHLYFEQAKVFTAQYQSIQKSDFLYKAQTAYQKALTIFEITKHTVSDQASRQVFMKNNMDFFEAAIDLNFQIWKQENDSTTLNEILFLTEKSKNDFLYERLNKMNTSITDLLPDSILQEINDLDLLVSQTEKKLFQAQMANDKITISSARDELINYRKDQKNQLEYIEKKYPQFYQLKYHTSVPTLAALQEKLLSDEGIISYYVGTKHLYVLLFDKWNFSVERVPMDFSLSQKLNAFNNSIVNSANNSSTAKIALADYHETGFFLYQKLIAPFVRKLPAQLIILPDNLLENLAFEALLTEVPTPRTKYSAYPFLLNKYTISYQYSLDAICRNTTSTKTPRHHFLAVAPTFEGDQPFSISELRDFGQLTHNRQEVDKIKKIIGSGTLLKSTEATEENFVKLAPDYQIIHLATHGKVNAEHANYSYLAFQEIKDSLENELLYIQDIYGLQLNAELVVLSACETANGSLAKGEGIINLARGFTYAGASAVVPTLWKISDIATAKLMEQFYIELKSGQPKHIAMTKAKRHFLETAGPDLGHPFYWAAFAMIGDVSPIIIPQQSISIFQISALWWGTGTIFILFLGYLGYLRIRK